MPEMAEAHTDEINAIATELQSVPDAKIDTVLERARRESVYRRLEALYDTQVNLIESLGAPAVLAQFFRQPFKRDMVVLAAIEHYPFPTPNDWVPFLPVIPVWWLSYLSQIEMVYNKTDRGRIAIDVRTIKDCVNHGEYPYYILNVDHGGGQVASTSKEATAAIKKDGRLPLTCSEMLALARHTDVVSRHGIAAPGSRCHGKEIPIIAPFTDQQQPILGHVPFDWQGKSASADLRVPSCARRLKLKTEE